MNNLKKFPIYLAVFIVISGLFLDQITKYAAEEILLKEPFQNIDVIKGFFSWTLAYNTGAGWSIMEGQFLFFYIYTTVVLIAIAYFYYRIKNSFFRLSMSLIASGAIGNFIDRIFRKQVIDFFHFIIFGYEFPIFNVADILVVSGTIGLLIYFLMADGKNKNVIES